MDVHWYPLKSLLETLGGLLQGSAGSWKTAAYQEALIVERARTVLVSSGNSIRGSHPFPLLQGMEDHMADRDPRPERGADNLPWVPIRWDGEEDCATVLAVMSWKLCSIAVWKQSRFWGDEKKGTDLCFKWDKKIFISRRNILWMEVLIHPAVYWKNITI